MVNSVVQPLMQQHLHAPSMDTTITHPRPTITTSMKPTEEEKASFFEALGKLSSESEKEMESLRGNDGETAVSLKNYGV